MQARTPAEVLQVFLLCNAFRKSLLFQAKFSQAESLLSFQDAAFKMWKPGRLDWL